MISIVDHPVATIRICCGPTICYRPGDFVSSHEKDLMPFLFTCRKDSKDKAIDSRAPCSSTTQPPVFTLTVSSVKQPVKESWSPVWQIPLTQTAVNVVLQASPTQQCDGGEEMVKALKQVVASPKR